MLHDYVDKQECQRTIKWLCDYVEYQAKQPAPFHSRDLHSMMVAAFNCLLTWIASHPWLLDDQVFIYAWHHHVLRRHVVLHHVV
jgi:hypothetical protein